MLSFLPVDSWFRWRQRFDCLRSLSVTGIVTRADSREDGPNKFGTLGLTVTGIVTRARGQSVSLSVRHYE